DEGKILRELYRLARDDYRTAEALRRLEADERYYETNPAARTSVSDGDRRRAVALARDEGLARLQVELALADLRARSRRISEGLARARTTGTVVPNAQVWDVLVVGAGIHDQVLNNVLARDSSNLRVLTVEKMDVVASNFALAGSGGRVNSTTRPTVEGVAPKPGTGNLNEFPAGTLQVPDASTTKNPAFRVLSDVATVNRAASRNPVLFGESVARVEELPGAAPPKGNYAGPDGKYYYYYGIDQGREFWYTRRNGNDSERDYTQTPPAPGGNRPARYMVTLVSGEVLYTNAVVYSTGLGSPATPRIDESSRATLERGEAAGTAFTYERFMRRAASEAAPYRAFDKKVVAVVGTGDSAKVAIEWLLRLAPDAGYGVDTTQTGLVEKIIWIGQTAADCKEFIQNVRVRYADIAGGIKSGIIEAVPGRLELAGVLGDGKYLLTTDSKESRRADYIITATGYESRIEDTLRPIVEKDGNGKALGATNPVAQSDLVTDIRANLPDRANNAIVARELRGQRIYFMGAAAGTIVPVEEVANVPENLKSIYGLGPRTQAFAEFLEKNVTERVSVPAETRDLIELREGAPQDNRFPIEGVANEPGRETNPFVDLALEAQLRAALKVFTLGPGIGALTLTLQRAARGEIEVLLSKGIGAGKDKLRAAIESSGQLLRDLETVLGPKDSRNAVTLELTGEEGKRVSIANRMRIGPASDSPGIVRAFDAAVEPAARSFEANQDLTDRVDRALAGLSADEREAVRDYFAEPATSAKGAQANAVFAQVLQRGGVGLELFELDRAVRARDPNSRLADLVGRSIERERAARR
ncbi:MAG: hypothetical protein ACAI25_19365, partial [Planctomycetota bacterium]